MKEIDRVFGLDILRFLAIVLVVFGHSQSLLPTNIPFLSNLRLPDGVDLFFVLSGYLIGLILIKTIDKNETINFPIIAHFLKRRWFRTLPNYYLFLFINIILIYFSLIPGQLNKFLSTYFVFMQNFHKPYDFLFWESWSLSVEEWFYLITPILLFILFKIVKPIALIQRKRLILITIGLLILFPLLFRIVQSSSDLSTDIYFRKLVLTRLDTIAFGIFSAYISFYHQSLWRKYKNTLFIAGVVFITSLLYWKSSSVFFNQTFYFTFMSLSISLLLPKLSSLHKENIPLKPIQFISKISYSMYLSHLPIMYVLMNLLKEVQSVTIVYCLFWITTILISSLVYFTFEKPMMNLRDKSFIFRKNKFPN